MSTSTGIPPSAAPSADAASTSSTRLCSPSRVLAAVAAGTPGLVNGQDALAIRLTGRDVASWQPSGPVRGEEPLAEGGRSCRRAGRNRARPASGPAPARCSPAGRLSATDPAARPACPPVRAMVGGWPALRRHARGAIGPRSARRTDLPANPGRRARTGGRRRPHADGPRHADRVSRGGTAASASSCPGRHAQPRGGTGRRHIVLRLPARAMAGILAEVTAGLASWRAARPRRHIAGPGCPAAAGPACRLPSAHDS